MGSNEQIQTTNVKVFNIEPAHPQESGQFQIIYPSRFDAYLADYYTPSLFVYKLDPSPEEYSRFISRVKDSLERILVPFYGFAGRWYPDEHHGRKLICNGKGVPFVEAFLDKNVESVVEASSGFRPVAGLNGYEALGMNAFEDRQDMTSEGLPPIFVQITRFNAGGVILGVTFNHMHTDGKSFFDFLSSWAAIARNEKIAIQPNFDRSAVSQVYKPPPKASLETSKATDNGDNKGISLGSKFSGSARITKTYQVDKSCIAAMKEAVNQQKNGLYVSTVDCIVAHTWKSFFQLPDSAITKTGLYIVSAVEGRKRFFDLSLENMVGNVVTSLVCPSFPANEIISKAPHELALLHRKTLLETKRGEWFSAERISERMRAFVSGWFTVSSWLSFPVYDLDFGVGGKPYFSPGVNKCAKSGNDVNIGECRIIPPIPSNTSSAATISWTCPIELIIALESSTDFLGLFLK